MLLGVARGDGEDEAARLAGKVARLRIFPDEAGRFDRSVADVSGARARRLAVHADRRHREGEPAELRGGRAVRAGGASLRALLRGVARGWACPVETGVFGAKMAVELVNDGPVTIVLDA